MIDFIRFIRGRQQVQYVRFEPQFDGNAFLPHYALVPLSFQTQMNSLPLVTAGDFVHEGQLIARAENSASVHVHSPVPGVVSRIIDAQLPNGHSFRGIHIRTEGSFEILGKQRTPYPWRQSDQMQLLHFFDLAGLINTVGSIASLAENIRAAIKTGVKNLTVMLYDNDPTCMLDSFLAYRFTAELAEGIGIIAQALGAVRINIKISTGKKGRMLYDVIAASLTGWEVSYHAVPTAYPSESGHGRSVEKNTVVIDTVTALSAYESVIYNQPMLTTYVLLTGKTLECAKVMKVRIGTPIGHLVEECGGFSSKNTHIIINGLLRGTLIDSLDLPVGKGIKSIHAVSKDVGIQKQLEECIHCGQCLQCCPVFIDPINTVRQIQRERYTADVLHSVELCSGCACCSAVCPARIPLCAVIQSAATRVITARGAGYAS